MTLAAAMLGLKAHHAVIQAGEGMQTLLDAVQMPHPVVATYARDYQPLERLALEQYVVLDAKP